MNAQTIFSVGNMFLGLAVGDLPMCLTSKTRPSMEKLKSTFTIMSRETYEIRALLSIMFTLNRQLGPIGD